MTAQTIGDVRNLIKRARAVYVRPFLGVLETWVKISKPEARAMFSAHADDKTIMDAFDFDHTLSLEDNGNLYLG